MIVVVNSVYMNILVVSPIYPSVFSAPNSTPLVHYYTRKWVEQGHKVKVIHLCCKYPKLFYWFGRHFNKFISSKLGIAIANKSPWAYEEVNEGVDVHHILVNKYVPHGSYSKSAIRKTIIVADSIIDEFAPDIIVGHWANPTLDILASLKEKYGIRCGIVLHETANQLKHYFKDNAKSLLDKVDIVGYRSKPLKDDIERHFGVHNCFMAYSGVPESFLETAAKEPPRTFERIEKFIFVGALIQRKYPAEILYALTKSYRDSKFTMIYIGAGKQDSTIRAYAKLNGILDQVTLTGRIPREDIMSHLKKSDVFIMISKSEVYGLVYLEAMAFGCIPVASKNEGFDGIIIDGENGFLCEAGNVEELSAIIQKIRQLSKEELMKISQNARTTAMRFGDNTVAKDYLEKVNIG